MKKLYEILVPTRYGDGENKHIRTVHHKQWDKRILSLTGGLTILTPAKGKWIYKGVEQPAEKVIPVRIQCDESLIKKIIEITLSHYRQKCVMYSVLSSESYIIYNKNVDIL